MGACVRCCYTAESNFKNYWLKKCGLKTYRENILLHCNYNTHYKLKEIEYSFRPFITVVLTSREVKRT
jgi:hypothetical protein